MEDGTPTHDRVCQCRPGYFYAHVGSFEICSPCSTWVALLGGPWRGTGPCMPRGLWSLPPRVHSPALPRSPAHLGQVFAPLCSLPPGESHLPSWVLPLVETLFSLLLSVFAEFSACLSLIHDPPASWHHTFPRPSQSHSVITCREHEACGHQLDSPRCRSASTLLGSAPTGLRPALLPRFV